MKRTLIGFMLIVLISCFIMGGSAEGTEGVTIFSLSQYAIDHFYIQPRSFQDMTEVLDVSNIDPTVTEVSFMFDQNMVLLGGRNKEGKVTVLLYTYGEEDLGGIFNLLKLFCASYRMMTESTSYPDEHLMIIFTVENQQYVIDTQEKADEILGILNGQE